MKTTSIVSWPYDACLKIIKFLSIKCELEHMKQHCMYGCLYAAHTFPFGNSVWPVVGSSMNTLSKDPHIVFKWKIQHHGKYLSCRGNLTFTVTFLSVKHSVEGKMPKEQGARQSLCLWGEIKLCLFSSLVLILTTAKCLVNQQLGTRDFQHV